MKQRIYSLGALLSLVTAIMLLSIGSAAASDVSQETLDLIEKAGGKAEYPDADAIIILDKMDAEFTESGTAMIYNYGLTRILTEAGIDRFGEKHVPFYRVYDAVRIITARVIKQDGSAVDVPVEDIKEISSAGGEYMNIYDPDALDRVIAFKNLEIGDCIEYYYLDSLFHAPMDGNFDAMDIFQNTVPILKKTVTVVGPASMPVKHIVKNGEVPFTKTEKGDKIEYVWQVEDMPMIVTEPAMPSIIEIAPTVIATTIDSWEDVSRWWGEIAESKYVVSDELKAEVASLIEGATTREEKVDAVYHFVAQKVRYMGLGTGKKKGFEPKPVSETYETKYGVCRDVAALMVAMLREAEVDCEIVLTNMGGKVYDDLPYIGFNHAIVAITNDDGSYTYADPTVENSVNWLPAMEAEQQVLVCSKAGTSLSDTPYSPPQDNMGHIKANSTLDESGLYTSDVTLTTYGFYDMALRSFIKRVPPAQQKIIFSYFMQDIYPGTVLKDFSTSDAEDLKTPLVFNFSYEIPNYPLEAGEFLLVKNPVALGVFDMISSGVFQTAALPERQYPWNLGFTFGTIEEETVNLPLGYTIKAVPDTVVKLYGPIEYRMAYDTRLPAETDKEALHQQVTYRKELMLNSKRVSTEDYKKLKEVLQAKAKSARGQIILSKEES